MNLLNLLGGNNGELVEQLAQRFGIDGSQAQSVVGQLLPALTTGFSQHAQQGGGLSSLLGSLEGQAAPAAQALPQQPQAVDAGNGILQHIFGDKDVSRQVAQQTAQQTGVEPSVIKKMLPLLAVVAANALRKKLMNQPQQAHEGLLGQLLGGTQGHPMADTVLGLLGQRSNNLASA